MAAKAGSSPGKAGSASEGEARRLGGRQARFPDRFHRHRVHGRRLRAEPALRFLREIELLAVPRPAAHDTEKQHRAGGLGGLELVEAGEGYGVLEGAGPVEPLEERPDLGAHLGEGGLARGLRLEHGRELDVTQGEAAVGHPLHRREQQPLGRELEVHGTLGQDAVLELEGARVPGQHVGQDPLDLHARGVAQLALVHEAAFGQHLGEWVARTHLGVDLVELLARDAAALDEDRAQLVARVVRGAEEDAASPEVESLGMQRAGDLEGSRGPVAMQIHEEMGERRRLDVPADRERFRHPPSTARGRALSRVAGQNFQKL